MTILISSCDLHTNCSTDLLLHNITALVERYRTYFENKRHEFEKFLKINFIEFGVVLLPSKWFLTRNAVVEIPTGGKGPLRLLYSELIFSNHCHLTYKNYLLSSYRIKIQVQFQASTDTTTDGRGTVNLNSTGLFKVIIGVLTTCHTQYT